MATVAMEKLAIPKMKASGLVFLIMSRILMRVYKDSTVTSGAKLSMIVETGWLRKNNKPTCCPRGTGHSKHGINRYVYIYIGHDSSVGVCLSSKR